MGVKVVADTHVLVFYLFTPDRLTDTALDALLHAENTDGIVVSVATFADLWYASQKTRRPRYRCHRRRRDRLVSSGHRLRSDADRDSRIDRPSSLMWTMTSYARFR